MATVRTLQAENKRLKAELGLAYQALHGVYASFMRKDNPEQVVLGNIEAPIFSAVRFVKSGALDGTAKFEDASVEDRRAVLRSVLEPTHKPKRKET